MKPYRDPDYRYGQIKASLRQQFLDRRRFAIQDPIARLGASLAIAGAAAVSRMTLCSLDVVLELLAAGPAEVDLAVRSGRWRPY